MCRRRRTWPWPRAWPIRPSIFPPSEDYQILLYWDAGSTRNGNNCGTGPGQTCRRCYTIDCEGCCQAQEKTYIWNNDGVVREYIGGSADDCLIEGTTYFLREPTLAQDGFTFTRYTYPHPLVSGVSDADGGTPSGSAVDDVNQDEAFGDGRNSGLGCFISTCGPVWAN
jgi:hypothetical protein